MSHYRNDTTSSQASTATRGQELRVFLFLTILLAPIVAIAVVGGVGLSVWLMQVFGGAPGVG